MSKKVTIAVLMVVLALAGAVVYSLLSTQSLSVLSLSQVKLGSNGKPYWVMQLAPSGAGEKVQFFSPAASNLETYTDLSGGKYVPQYDFWVQFDPAPITCTYALQDDTRLSTKLLNYLGVFDENVQTFDVGELPERSAPIRVTTSKNPVAQSIDGFSPRQQISFNAVDGGSLIIESQGGLAGKIDCVDTGADLKVIQGQTTGRTSFITDKSTGIIEHGSIRDAFKQNYKSCEITSDKSKLVCVLGESGTAGVGTITVTADAEYLDTRYYPPTMGTPKIVSIVAQSEIQKSSYGSAEVTVKNTGEADGVFLLRGTKGMTILPSVQTVRLASGDSSKLYLQLVAPDVSNDKSVESTLEFCSTSQFSAASCDTSTFKVDVRVKGGDAPSCGDAICQVSENYQTCPNDCAQVRVCEANHMKLESGVCRCEAGFHIMEDEIGAEYCAADTGNALIIIGVFVVIILLAVAIKLSRRK